jgi:hypothetical protein
MTRLDANDCDLARSSSILRVRGEEEHILRAHLKIVESGRVPQKTLGRAGAEWHGGVLKGMIHKYNKLLTT